MADTPPSGRPSPSVQDDSAYPVSTLWRSTARADDGTPKDTTSATQKAALFIGESRCAVGDYGEADGHCPREPEAYLSLGILGAAAVLRHWEHVAGRAPGAANTTAAPQQGRHENIATK